ncbi:MAG TPA: outer membrane beta-barrel protein [Vicinamibacteria bacterium]|nr:outer membrane beta-barrel protein [Vicinamibacteria bacterium]
MITAARPALDGHPANARWRSALAVAALLLVAAPSAHPADWAIGADAGWFSATNWPESAKAIFDGASGGVTYGGFLRFGLGERFFVSGHVRYFEKEGERVFVADAGSPVFRLGHPLTIRLVPAYAMLGYRFTSGGRFSPYVGVGAGATSYRETSDVAGLIETSSRTNASGHLAAGVDFGRGGLRVGAEVVYSLVPNTIGEAGVSRIYGETDVGGVTAVLRVSFGSRAP